MHDEIDIGKVLLDLWDGKWKIITSSIIALFISLGFIFPEPQPSYKAIIDINPINSIEARQYESLNYDNLLNITPETLINLYIEQAEYKKLFINVIKDLDIYKKSDYKTEDDYNNAILNLVSKIKMLPSSESNEKKYRMTFSHEDKKLGKNIFKEFHKINEKFIKNELIQRYNQKVIIINQKRILDLENILTLKNNAKADFDKQIKKYQIERGFEAEDIKVFKENAIKDYHKSIKKRLAFLYEQGQIARKLGISQSTFDTQIFNAQNGAVTSLSADTPFYLRGYKAIEKEIELLSNRKDKTTFVEDLFELERRERALEQDKTLERAELNKMLTDSLFELEKKERALKQDRTLERVEINFKLSPLMNKSFLAVNFNIEVQKIDYKNNKYSTVILAIFLGLFVGSIYVLFSNFLINRKN